MEHEQLEAEAREEIEALHRFFVGWFSGELPQTAFESGFTARFASDFLIIPPAGTVLGLGDLSNSIERAHGSNPEFRIAIRNVCLRRVTPSQLLVTYEEWQRNALATTPPDNARVATVWFERGTPLKWLHVHETTMPEALVRAGPFDF